MSVISFICFSIYSLFHLSFFLSIPPSIYPSYHISSLPSIHFSIFPSIPSSIYPSFHLSIYPSFHIYQSICLPINTTYLFQEWHMEVPEPRYPPFLRPGKWTLSEYSVLRAPSKKSF